ncbi:hypothetical protein EIO_1270 [Ketogulonicigenium vulgare Y25]|uniref:Uncharacterized protein n=1 Tax=Ketogulonicigenium vulgare (strain WSH-001) TaxID=759362 RepID=F9Y4Q6_KETVW|nr:hypothetical protein EIO_1270 [Ketogulonicigenium vulgare Y25]AEM40613.1 hypothetical protein KVU_0774 [Ketogulonicigenium vulgare WSH-001]ALJ80786.1 hypothetical protein KVH_06105 [Ketogulonicigenium vulgare]ANW34989.1 hypothetical protein KvSKV_06075 [Ketogulonicigenium vulgare]AOZ54324.1 hypothetical protein KVC_1307 [Ketogulonicigenium vulgare]
MGSDNRNFMNQDNTKQDPRNEVKRIAEEERKQKDQRADQNPADFEPKKTF